MVGVENLFERQEQTARVVECTLHHAFIGVASYGAHGQSPSVLVKAGGIGNHAAEHVVGVGIGHRTVEAGGVGIGYGVIVNRTAKVAEAVCGGIKTYRGGFVAESTRGHAQQRREVESSAHEVVHGHAVDVYGLIGVVEAAETIVHGAEIV